MWNIISIYNFHNILHETRTMANGQYEAFSKHLFINSSMCNMHTWVNVHTFSFHLMGDVIVFLTYKHTRQQKYTMHLTSRPVSFEEKAGFFSFVPFFSSLNSIFFFLLFFCPSCDSSIIMVEMNKCRSRLHFTF